MLTLLIPTGDGARKSLSLVTLKPINRTFGRPSARKSSFPIYSKFVSILSGVEAPLSYREQIFLRINITVKRFCASEYYRKIRGAAQANN